jgi:23S rRNA (cytidine1920-2'-O)/16S rRNA (cytidine1409-2'-O)-methyltransferase
VVTCSLLLKGFCRPSVEYDILHAMAAKAPSKRKLIERLVSEGLVDNRESAEKQIRAGLVRVEGAVVDKPGTLVSIDAQITMAPRKDFVGRGALKLAGALDSFLILPQSRICADVGACTGGFTEVLLQRGAEKVYAIDVGYGDLDWKIRTNPRVVVMERTNVRYVDQLPDPISLVTIDVSFISLTKVLPVIARWLVPGGTVVALVKPQFEAAREEVGEGGIIASSEIHERVLSKIHQFLSSVGLLHRGTIPSPILGTEGNKEFLMWAERA